MQNPVRILFAAGGTGGHVYPAIALAGAVQRLAPETTIAFAGTRDRLEWKAVPKAGYDIYPITVSGFHRRQMIRNLGFPFKLIKGLFQSFGLIGRFDPDVVVGTGGFTAGPVLLAAQVRGRRTLLQEQNAYPGVTNRLLAKRTDRVHIAFPEAQTYFRSKKCILSGNPTRSELSQVSRNAGRKHYSIPDSADVLFVFGGSLGSAALNEILEIYHKELLENDNLHIVWQTGALYYQRINTKIIQHPRLILLEYVDRMDLTYAAADLAVCRAGAITCSELLVTGTPSILVPSPNVAEDHQTKNAISLVKAGAAVLLAETNLKERIVEEIRSLLANGERRVKMREAAIRSSKPEAADVIAQDILALASKHRK